MGRQRERIDPTIGEERRSRKHEKNERYERDRTYDEDYGRDRYVRVRNLESSKNIKDKILLAGKLRDLGYIYLAIATIYIGWDVISGMDKHEIPWYLEGIKDHLLSRLGLFLLPFLILWVKSEAIYNKAKFDDWYDRGNIDDI